MKKLFVSFALLSSLSFSAFAGVQCVVNTLTFSGQYVETANLQVNVAQIKNLTRLEVKDLYTDVRMTTSGDLMKGPLSLNVYRPNGVSDSIVCVLK